MYERTTALVSLPVMSKAVRRLKIEVKKDAKTINEMRRRANELEGLEKHYLQMEAREHGSTVARNRLLAYAMLRGRTLEAVEGFSRRPPCPTTIGRFIRKVIDQEIPPDVTISLCSTTAINRWLGWDGGDWGIRWQKKAEAKAAA